MYYDVLRRTTTYYDGRSAGVLEVTRCIMTHYDVYYDVLRRAMAYYDVLRRTTKY